MTISPVKKGAIGSKVSVDLDNVPVSFEKWAQPGHFSKTLSKGPVSTTWVWNLHADVHDFDTQTTNLEVISRRVFSAHFGQLAIIMIWLSGMFFHGARFSNYEAWVANPMQIKPSAQIVWPIVGQEILNGDLGAGTQGIQITSGLFHVWRSSGITDELQLYSCAVGGLLLRDCDELRRGHGRQHSLWPARAWRVAWRVAATDRTPVSCAATALESPPSLALPHVTTSPSVITAANAKPLPTTDCTPTSCPATLLESPPKNARPHVTTEPSTFRAAKAPLSTPRVPITVCTPLDSCAATPLESPP